MKIIEVSGNGACLFSSLRLGFELLTVVQKLRKTNVSDERFEKSFYGHGPLINSAAEALRLLICKWYSPVYFDKEVSFVDGVSTRRKILELELCTTETSHLEMYVEAMKNNKKWGSFPEIIAFAMMLKCEIIVYHATSKDTVKDVKNVKSDSIDVSIDEQLLKKPLLVTPMQQVKHPEGTGTIHLLFSGNHYDLLIDDDEYIFLEKAYAFLRHRVSACEVQKQ